MARRAFRFKTTRMDTGEKDLRVLISHMAPALDPARYVFATVPSNRVTIEPPLMRFQEAEGDTLILTEEAAVRESLPTDRPFRRLTLTVHSDLDAVGLTAAVAMRLTEHGISANVVAAYYHDHIFVSAPDADRAYAALCDLTETGP